MLTPPLQPYFSSLSVEIRTKNVVYLFTNTEYICIINLCPDFIKYLLNTFINSVNIGEPTPYTLLHTEKPGRRRRFH